jgi:hypothetical protein
MSMAKGEWKLRPCWECGICGEHYTKAGCKNCKGEE